MLTFNSLQFLTLLSTFFWPMIRILSFFSSAPIFNDKIINRKNKIILSFIISWLIFPFLPKIQTNLFSYFGLLLLFQQILIGLVLGFTAQFLLITVNLAGEIIGLQMGLSFATFFNNNSHIGTSVISRLLNVLTLFIFLILNIHLYLISILIDSFYSMPVDSYFLNKSILFSLLNFSSHFFLKGILLVLPVILILLLISFIMSILNRLSPQISIFSIGFPINLLIGITTLYYLMFIMFPFLKKLLYELLFMISNIFLHG